MIGERAFREAIRTVNVAYAVPYVATLLGITGISCFALAIPESGGVKWVVTLAGFASVFGAITAILYAVFLNPGLLRSGRYVTEQRLIDIISDASQDAEARSIAGNVLVLNLPDIDVARSKGDQPGAGLAEREDDAND